MIRTKHLVIFIALFVGGLLGVVMTFLIMRAEALSVVNRQDATFIEGRKEFNTELTKEVGTDDARAALIAKLALYQDDSAQDDSAQDNEVIEGDSFIVTKNLEEEKQTTENKESNVVENNEPLPVVIIKVGDMEKIGVHGSYCWGDICSDSIIADLPPDDVIEIQGTSTIKFNIVSRVQPTQIYFSLHNVSDTKILFGRALTERELNVGGFEIAPPQGEYLLFMTGVWPDGDVVNIFKIVSVVDKVHMPEIIEDVI